MADEDDVNIGGKAISSLRVVDLKKECEKRGLTKSGSKSQLVERLKTQLLLENLGKDTNAPAQGLQEEECQNEFIKQYLAQQKQLIENVESSMNSSSQESDADDSPRKRRSLDQSPPFHSPPVEISPEKPAPVAEKEEPALEEKQDPIPANSSGETTQELFKQSENLPGESKSEGAIEESETMGRTKRRLSRLDSGSKSQGDLSDTKPANRSSRRTRNSGSAGDEVNVESSKDVTSKDKAKETVDEVEAPEPVAEQKKAEEKMDVDTDKNEKQTNGEKEKEKIDEEPNNKEDMVGQEKSGSRSRSNTPPPAEKTSKPPVQVSSSMKRRSRLSSSSSSSSSSSRSRSREKSEKGRRSSSSSSSRSRSRSSTPKKKKEGFKWKKTERGAERSGSSSKSRSRSPTPKKVKTQPTTSEDMQKQKSPERQEIKEVKKEIKEVKKRSPSRSRSFSPVNAKEQKADPNTTVEEPMEVTPVPPKEAEVKVNSEPSKDASGIQQSDVKVGKKISLNRKTIEEAGKTPEESGEGDKAEGVDKPPEEKPAKKRKWGSRSASTAQKAKKVSSMPISTESLKDLMPDIKPSLKLAPEPVLEDEMDYEDDAGTSEQPTTEQAVTEQAASEQEDTRSVKIQRTVTQDVKKDRDSGESQSESEGEKEEEEEKEKQGSGDEEDVENEEEEEEEEDGEDKREIKEEIKEREEPEEEGAETKPKREEPTVMQTKTITVTTKVKKEKRDRNKEIKLIKRLDSGGSILVKPDEPIRAQRSPSPARNQVSNIVHIRNLVRPFTVNQLKELLKRTGNLNEELFWIDKIKSHCFAVYDTEDEAVETRKALHNTTWPLSNPKTLIVDFGSEEQMDYYRGDEKPIPPPEKKEKVSVREQKQKEKEEKQRLIQEERQKEIERRQKEREKRMKERMEKAEREKPVREWDKDKKSREDWDRTLQKSRSRSPRERRDQRSRSASPVRERRRERSRERSRERVGRREKKKERKDDEPPAKLLDDLFKKTKITPCIYWLPLTEAQIAEREKLGIVKPLLRQKQEGDRVSPMREIQETKRPEARRRRTSSPAPVGKMPQEADRSRGKRATPERWRRESSPDPRSRSGGRRR